jgi:hypothetical protein
MESVGCAWLRQPSPRRTCSRLPFHGQGQQTIKLTDWLATPSCFEVCKNEELTGSSNVFHPFAAVAFPSSSANVLSITGASGVMLVSYLIPVIQHFWLYFGL